MEDIQLLLFYHSDSRNDVLDLEQTLAVLIFLDQFITTDIIENIFDFLARLFDQRLDLLRLLMKFFRLSTPLLYYPFLLLKVPLPILIAFLLHCLQFVFFLHYLLDLSLEPIDLLTKLIDIIEVFEIFILDISENSQ